MGADGLIVEVHHDPPHAISDGRQSLYPEQFQKLMQEIKVRWNSIIEAEVSIGIAEEILCWRIESCYRIKEATSENYGGRFVPETLVPALDQLTKAYEEIKIRSGILGGV